MPKRRPGRKRPEGQEFYELLEERFVPEEEYFVRRGRWDRRIKQSQR